MEENLQEGAAQVSEAATENSVTESEPKKLKNYSITIPRVFPALLQKALSNANRAVRQAG